MKQILVLSDIHNDSLDHLSSLTEIINISDYIIFAGDGYNKLVTFLDKINFDKNKLFCIKGNCDSVYSLPDEKIFNIENVKIFLNHGNKLSVGEGTEFFEAIAKDAGCSLAIYGHTHIYDHHERLGLTTLNSGSLEKCRDDGRSTYSLMTIDGKKITIIKMYCRQ